MIVVSPAALACIVASVIATLGALALLVASLVVAVHGLMPLAVGWLVGSAEPSSPNGANAGR